MEEKIKFIIENLFKEQNNNLSFVIDMNNGEQSTIFFQKSENIFEIEYPVSNEDSYEYYYAIYDPKTDILTFDEDKKLKYVIEEFCIAIKEKRNIVGFK